LMTASHKTDGRVAGRDRSRSGAADAFERLVWWLFAGSTGGRTRLLVLLRIRKGPRNAKQLSQDLGFDYTTIRHHLKVLETNGLVIAEGGNYGRVYFVSESMDSRWDRLETISKRKPRRKERAGN
jgi:DNA-binding transcriptional ArsR family regulator